MKALLAIALLAAACGDDHPVSPDAPAGCGDCDAPPDGADTRDILVRLRAAFGATADVAEQTPQHAPAGYRYFVLQVQQPVDHANPTGDHFAQEVSLIHRDVAAPMVRVTTGYDDYFRDYADEATQLIAGNQISIEHRYFGSSRPAALDWSKVTIQQEAEDEHAIIATLKTIYTAPWIATGASKGGMTAAFLHRFHPEDLAGSISYVAPLSFAIPDARYVPQFETVGTQACRDQVKALATELLHHRRAAMLARAQAAATANGDTYTRIAIGPAVESAIQDLEWTFWQYYGLGACGSLPQPTDTDDNLYQFLDAISPINFSADASTAMYETYFYQAYTQLGSPGLAAVRGDSAPTQLAPYVMYAAADYAGTLPAGQADAAYDPAPMQDIDDWVQNHGEHLVFLYGQNDPWSAGAFRLGAGSTDSLEVTVANGTHGAQIVDLAPADRDAVLAKLAAWTGVTPIIPAHLHRRPEMAGPRRRYPM